MPPRKYKIVVCRGPECGERRGSRGIYEAFCRAVDERGVHDRVTLDWQSCFGRCMHGPNALVREVMPAQQPSRFVFATPPPGRRSHSALYNHLTEADAAAVVDEHVIDGRILHRLIERLHRSKTSE